MKSDKAGCSTCPPGEEQYEEFTQEGQKLIQYDYRTIGGVLFSTVTTSLEVARIKRDNWLKSRGLK